MAVFHSTLFSSIRGTLGNVTVYRLQSTNVMRSNVRDVRDARTPAQLKHREKWRMLMYFSSGLKRVLEQGFPALAARERTNRFVSCNMAVADCTDEGQVVFDYPRLCLSSGELLLPDVTASLSEAGDALVFSQRRQPLKPLMYDDDALYGVVWMGEKFAGWMIPLHLRGETAELHFPLPKELKGRTFQVYAFAVNARRTQASQTLWAGEFRG